MMEGHNGALQHGQQTSHQHQPHGQQQQDQPYYGYNPNSEYHYPPGQHWLTGSNVSGHPPISDHNYNANNGGLHGYGYNNASSHTNNNNNGNVNGSVTSNQSGLSSSHNSHISPHYTSLTLHGHNPSPVQHHNINSQGGHQGVNVANGSAFPSNSLQQSSYHCCPVPAPVCASSPAVGNNQNIAINQNNNNCNNSPNNNHNHVSISNMMLSGMCPRINNAWGNNTENGFPGGLEVLWREVPEECQKLMTSQDIPDSAKFRGYFTVCELIGLKRSLLGRMNGDPVSDASSSQSQQLPNSNDGCVEIVVKDSINALEEGSDQNAVQSELKDETPVNPTASEVTSQRQGDAMENKTEESATSRPETLRSPIAEPTMASTTAITKTTVSSTASSSCHLLQAQAPAIPHFSQVHQHSQNLMPHSNMHATNANMGPPPPPYRTATLVFRLLQIGNYQFRSFSEINPNRLRVLFNTQRITYECQLSVIRPPKEGMQYLRKLLTVDIGFDQISNLRFGNDKLFLRVEGAPLLTVTYHPCNDDRTCPPLSEQDNILLDQIDRGQLKLSPCHQLYFLNERLVNLLEGQFKEHPRFRDILMMKAYDSPVVPVTPAHVPASPEVYPEQNNYIVS